MNLYFWLTWLMAAIVLGLVSKTTKLGFWGGFFVSLFLTPLVGLMVVIMAKPKNEKGH